MPSETAILLKLLCAHLLADFVLQPRALVDEKRSRKQAWHIVHAAVHMLLAFVLLSDLSLWYAPVVIGITHYAIDLWKSYRRESAGYFAADQALHLLVIGLLWLFALGGRDYLGTMLAGEPLPAGFWAVATGLVLVCKPSSIAIGGIIAWKKWDKDVDDIKQGLSDAGEWIGYLERLLIFTFVYNGIYEAVGFLLAAKSIFRFGELKNAKEIKITEYIMIGTFMSFAIAIAVGLTVKQF